MTQKLEVKEEEKEQESTVTLPEETVVEQTEETLTKEELADVEKLGLNKKEDDEHQEQPDAKTKDNTKEKEEEVDEHPTFEQIDQNKDLLKKYNKNEQALYWKYKSDRRKRQEAEESAEELKAKLELNSVREQDYKSKIQKAIELIKDENKDLTAAELLKVLDYESVNEKVKEVEKKETTDQEKFQKRIAFIEEMGKAQHEDFDNLIEMAKEVVTTIPRYQMFFRQLLVDPSIDAQDVIDEVIEIAKKNPKFSKGKEASAADKEKVEKAIKNSAKKTSSASVSSGGNRIIPESELTLADAAKLSVEQWRKLKPETKKRLSML